MEAKCFILHLLSMQVKLMYLFQLLVHEDEK